MKKSLAISFLSGRFLQLETRIANNSLFSLDSSQTSHFETRNSRFFFYLEVTYFFPTFFTLSKFGTRLNKYRSVIKFISFVSLLLTST